MSTSTHDELSHTERPKALTRSHAGVALSGYFFEEVKTYIGFSDEDATRLVALYSIVSPRFESLVVAFYDALESNPRTRMIFSGEQQLERLRVSLRGWLHEVFSGPYDESYFERRFRIGRVHVEVGLLPQFMFGAMNILRTGIIDALIAHKAAHGAFELDSSVRAVERILDLELTIMLQSYWETMMDLKLQVPKALATGLAHEIRNPLNGINLNLTLLERRMRSAGIETDHVHPIFESLRGEVRRIRGLTSEIMDFAKPIEISPRWYDARDLLHHLQTLHGPTLDASNIELHQSIEGDSMIWCDPDRIIQVLLNLLTNAVEAIEAKGAITITVRTDQHSTQIEVADDGEGMSPSLKYQVFDVFFTTKATGTGLGLPIVAKIIEAHGGAIDVHSHIGQGTRFAIVLPRPRLQEDS